MNYFELADSTKGETDAKLRDQSSGIGYIIDEILKEQKEDYYLKIQGQIMDILREKGYSFGSAEEFYKFSQEHLYRVRAIFPDTRKTGYKVYLDEEYLCEWVEEWTLGFDPATFTATATLSIF